MNGLFMNKVLIYPISVCTTDVLRALQNNVANIYNARNNTNAENFKLKFCMCAQSIALGTPTKFQLEILMRNMILVIYKFRENILESSRNVSEISPRFVFLMHTEWLSAEYIEVLTLKIVFHVSGSRMYTQYKGVYA